MVMILREAQNTHQLIEEMTVESVIGDIEHTRMIDVEIEIVEMTVEIIEIVDDIIVEGDQILAIITQDIDLEVEATQDNVDETNHFHHQVFLDRAHHDW